MNIPGHLAVAVVQDRLLDLSQGDQKTAAFLAISSLFPDIVDKTIAYILHLMPNGRHYAHNIFSLGITTLLVGTIWGKEVGYAWFMGYLGHLLADSQRLIPWFFPFKEYPFSPGQGLVFEPLPMLKEATILSAVLALYKLRNN